MLRLTKVASQFSKIKPLQTSAVSNGKNLLVTFPHVSNKTIQIQSPIQTFISSIAACQNATMRAIAAKQKLQLGKITFSKIESGYDLGHWARGGGKDNKINDINMNVQVQLKGTKEQFDKLLEQTQKLCPLYQIVTGSGIKINAQWTYKAI